MEVACHKRLSFERNFHLFETGGKLIKQNNLRFLDTLNGGNIEKEKKNG